MPTLAPRKKPNERSALRTGLLHIFEFFALLIAIFLVVFGVIAWQLSKGPLPLDAFQSDAEAALVRVFGGASARIGKLEADWSASEKAIVIAASNIQIRDQTGAVILAVPRFEAGLDGLSLLRRKLEFSRLVVIGGEVSIVRREDGAIGFGVGNVAQVLGNARVWQQQQTVQAPAILQAIANLQVLTLQGGALNLADLRSGIQWRAPDAKLSFRRIGQRIEFSADGIVQSKDQRSPLHVQGVSYPDFSNLSATARFENYIPSELIPDIGPLALLNRLQAPVSSVLTIATDAQGLLTHADFEVTASGGLLKLPSGDVEFKAGILNAAYDATDGVIVIDEAGFEALGNKVGFTGQIRGLDPAQLVIGNQIDFSLDFSPILLDLTGILPGPIELDDLVLAGSYLPTKRELSFSQWRLNANQLHLAGVAKIHWVQMEATENWFPRVTANARSTGHASFDEIMAFWPLQLAEGVRTWANLNMRQANLFDMILQLDVDETMVAAGGLGNEMLSLSFAFDDVTTTYFGTMPPLENSQGTGLLRGNRFDAKLTSGQLLSNELSDGFVEIPYLYPKGAVAIYGATASGPLSDLLTLLDQEPFGYASMYRIVPSEISGQGQVDFQLHRPMRTRVPFREMGFSAKGVYTDVSGTGLVFGQDISELSLHFEADQNAMMVTGEGAIGGWPSVFQWGENFKAGDAPRTNLSVETRIDASLFDDLGLPTRDFFSGEIGLDIQMLGNGLAVQTGTVRADITHASVRFEGLNWSKPEGEPGALDFQVSKGNENEYILDELVFQAQGLDIRGGLQLSTDTGLRSVQLTQAKMDGVFDFIADISRDTDEVFVIDADVRAADISGLVRGWFARPKVGEYPAARANIRFAQLVAGERLLLDEGALQFVQSSERLESLQLSGRSAQGEHQLVIVRGADGLQQMQASSSDSGAILHALFGVNSIHDGQLYLSGVLADDPALPSDLNLSITDFSLSNTPVVAKLLSLGSLKGLSDTLSGAAMTFRTLEVPMQTRDGFMSIRGARATGPAMGVTLDGNIDFGERNLKMHGNLAPAYTLNSILGAVPIVGSILVPREGEGVFGLSYGIEGPFDEMQVTVNPLSAFAPGVLRQMFGGTLPELEDAVRLKPAPKPAPTE